MRLRALRPTRRNLQFAMQDGIDGRSHALHPMARPWLQVSHHEALRSGRRLQRLRGWSFRGQRPLFFRRRSERRPFSASAKLIRQTRTVFHAAEIRRVGEWCQGGGLNSRPRAYESPALPLSYPGNAFRAAEISGFAPRGKCGVRSSFARAESYFAAGFESIPFTRSSMAAACLPSSEAASSAFTSPMSLRTVSLSCGGR